MSAVHQLQLQYDAHEDRGLLRIRTRDGAEFRFWVTRRFVTGLWPALKKLLEGNPRVSEQATAENRSAVLSFQHESALERSDFSTEFQEGASRLPLGEKPLLLSRLQVKASPAGGRILCLLPKDGQGVQLAMDDRLAHSFASLVQRTVRAADWNLDVDLAPPAAPGPPSRRLN